MRTGRLAVICGRNFDGAARRQTRRAKTMPVGAISLAEWTFRSARPSWRQRSGSATGRPTPLSVKGTMEQSCRWLIRFRNTHCWDRWTKNERGGLLYLDPTAGFRQDPGPHNHRRQRQGVRRPQSYGESPQGTILLCQTLSFLGTRIERAHQRLGAGVLPKGNGLSQGI